MRILLCLQSFIYWIKTGVYWQYEPKTLYGLTREILRTIRWTVLGMGIQKILEKIYIGDVEALMDSQRRKEYNIKAMICCAKEINPNLEGIRHFMWLPLEDCNWIESDFIEDTIRFIRMWKDEKILIACAGGASRSAGLILCYMIEEGWDMNEALKYVQKIRPVINPHSLILLSIRKYYKIPPY